MSDKTILIIEDNELNMKLARSLLQLEGYRVVEATDAETGLCMVREHHPNLVLMDIQLPGMDGLEATRIIRSDAAFADVPVVALTSYAMVGDRDAAMAAGCAGFLSKPIDTRTFIDSLRKHLRDTPNESPADSGVYRNRILVVDDDPLNIKLMVTHLAADDFDILTASTGTEAPAAGCRRATGFDSSGCHDAGYGRF